MKYILHENLVLVIEPETKIEQALIAYMEKLEIRINGHGIKNAGMSWEEGRRTYLSFVFKPKNPFKT